MIAKKTTFWRGPVLFILPAFVIYFMFMVVPIFGSVALSLVRWRGIAWSKVQFVGLENYKNLIVDPVFWQALRNNFAFMGMTVVLQCALALIVALLLEQKLVLGAFFRGSYFIPTILPLMVISIVFQIILSPSLGVLDKVLNTIGLHKLTGLGLWLGQESKALYLLVGIQVWFGFGWTMFIFISRLKTISFELYEAAATDGATKWQQLIYITLPQLKDTAAIAVFLAILFSLKVFTVPYVMTRGGPNHATEVLATFSYYQGFPFQHIGYGSAIANILVFIGGTIGIIYYKITGLGK